MQKLSTAVVLFLISVMAHGAVDSETASAPVQTVDLIYVVLFIVLFFASIIWFFWYLWWNDRKQKARDTEAK